MEDISLLVCAGSGMALAIICAWLAAWVNKLSRQLVAATMEIAHAHQRICDAEASLEVVKANQARNLGKLRAIEERLDHADDDPTFKRVIARAVGDRLADVKLSL